MIVFLVFTHPLYVDRGIILYSGTPKINSRVLQRTEFQSLFLTILKSTMGPCDPAQVPIPSEITPLLSACHKSRGMIYPVVDPGGRGFATFSSVIGAI